MKPQQIPLGYAVPSGDPVSIPVGHMAVVGQTQAAGKTTTLEACASRVPDEFAVLAFVTKRGEGGFTNGVLGVDPYFRERADWEYVSSILEATLRDQPVKPGVIVKEFARTGQSVHPSRLSEYLADFVQMGILYREEGNQYVKAPGCKIGSKTLEVV